MGRGRVAEWGRVKSYEHKAERYAFGCVFYLSARSNRTQAGWDRIQVPGFSESLFFRYVNTITTIQEA